MESGVAMRCAEFMTKVRYDRGVVRLSIFAALLCAAFSPAQTFVVMLDESMLEAAKPLLAHREAQGLDLVTAVTDELDADDARALMRTLIESSREPGYLLIVGDDTQPTLSRPGLRTYAEQYQVGAATIGSDLGFVDVDGDGKPEWSCGRIPVSTPAELEVVVRKILDYESAAGGTWQREVALIANAGDFGEFIDSMIENAVNQLFREELDPVFAMGGVVGLKSSPFHTRPEDFLDGVVSKFNQGPFAVVYAGHGHQTGFASVGGKPVLRNRHVPKLEGASRTLLFAYACHIARYRDGDCLGGVMLRHAGGPCAVFAAAGVSFPYGDVLLGHELMRAMRTSDGPVRVGDLVRKAKCALVEPGDNAYRKRADTLAGAAGLPADVRDGLRRYTSDLYHILGDPALVLQLPRRMTVRAPSIVGRDKPFEVTIEMLEDRPAMVVVELCVDRGKPHDPERADVRVRREIEWSEEAPLTVSLDAANVAGRHASVRVFGIDGSGRGCGGGVRFRFD